MFVVVSQNIYKPMRHLTVVCKCVTKCSRVCCSKYSQRTLWVAWSLKERINKRFYIGNCDACLSMLYLMLVGKFVHASLNACRKLWRLFIIVSLNACKSTSHLNVCMPVYHCFAKFLHTNVLLNSCTSLCYHSKWLQIQVPKGFLSLYM